MTGPRVADLDTQFARLRVGNVDGWLDGFLGKVITEATLTTARAFLDSIVASGLPTPHCYPTEDGNVRGEWSTASHHEVSVDCSADRIYFHSVDVHRYDDGGDLELDVPYSEAANVIDALRRLMPGNRGEDLIARTDQVGRAESRIAELEAELAEIYAAPPRFDFTAHLERQREWSSKTFGRSARAAGIVDHIRKELAEIEAAPADLGEWIDVAILALDGAWRTGAAPEQIIAALEAKQTKNEASKWPPLSEQAEDKATEHDRAADDVLGPDTPRRAFNLLESLVETGEATADERELYRRKKTESQLFGEALEYFERVQAWRKWTEPGIAGSAMMDDEQIRAAVDARHPRLDADAEQIDGQIQEAVQILDTAADLTDRQHLQEAIKQAADILRKPAGSAMSDDQPDIEVFYFGCIGEPDDQDQGRKRERRRTRGGTL